MNESDAFYYLVFLVGLSGVLALAGFLGEVFKDKIERWMKGRF